MKTIDSYLEILTKYKHVGLYEQSPAKFKDISKKLGWNFSQIKIIHVLGTNGKGSVCHFLNNVISANKKVGKFISPHVTKHNERITINNQQITDEDFIRILKKHINIIDSYLLNFFEIYLLVTIDYFLDRKIEVMILEAGIGGLYDSTNFLKRTDYMCVTSISNDHKDILGNTLLRVAFQKFLAFRFTNKKIITYLDNKKIFFFIQLIYIFKLKKIYNIKNKIKNVQLKNNEILFEFLNETWSLKTVAHYQANNAAIAISILLDMGYNKEIIQNNINRIPLAKSWEQIKIGSNFAIIDGAHNEDGIIKLCEIINNLNLDKNKIAIIFNARKDKNPIRLLEIFNNNGIKNIYIYLFENSLNKIKINEIPEHLYIKANNNLELLYSSISKRYKDIIFTGSLYFIGEVKNTLTKGK